MHEDDGDGCNAVRPRGFERGPQRIEVRRALHRAVDACALVHFDHALVEDVRLDDVLGENPGPRLVADLQCIAETLGDEEERARALALEQRIGRHRRAHLDRGDAGSGDRLAMPQSKQIADALHSGVAIGLGIFREELVRDERAIRPPSQHVGEGAAAVDPEIPALLFIPWRPPRLLHALIQEHAAPECESPFRPVIGILYLKRS